MFTIILISLGATIVVGTVVNEIRTWRKPGHSISQQAPSDNDQVNMVRLIQETNIHRQDRPGSPI